MQWEWYGPPFTLGNKPARVIHSRTQFTKRHTRIEQCVLSRDINHLVKSFQLLQAKRLSRGWRLGHFCLTHIATLAPRETRNASYHAAEPLLLYAVIGFLLLLISFVLPLLTILADHLHRSWTKLIECKPSFSKSSPCVEFSTPAVFVLSNYLEKSFLPLQVNCPSLVYPALHVHWYEPAVFWQTELTSHLSVCAAHSS